MLNKVDRVIEKETTEDVVKAYQLKVAQYIYEAGTEHYLQQPFRRDHLARLGKTTVEQAEGPVLESFEADCLQYQAIYKEELYNVGRINKVRLLAEQQHLSLSDGVAKQLAKAVRQEFHLACDVYRELYAADLRDDGQLDVAALDAEQARWNLGQSIVEAIAATEQSTFSTDQQEYYRAAAQSIHETGQLVNRPLHPLQVQFSFGPRLLTTMHGDIEQEFHSHVETYQQQFLDILRHNGAISDAARHQLEEVRQRLGNIHPSLLVDFETDAIETHQHNVTAYTDEAYQVIQQFTDGNIHEPTAEEQEALGALRHWYNVGPSIAAQIEQTVRTELAAQQSIEDKADTAAIAGTEAASVDKLTDSPDEPSITAAGATAPDHADSSDVISAPPENTAASVEHLTNEAIAPALTTDEENTVESEPSVESAVLTTTADAIVPAVSGNQDPEDVSTPDPEHHSVTSEEDAWNDLIRRTDENTLDPSAPAAMTVIALSDEPTAPVDTTASDTPTIRDIEDRSEPELDTSARQTSIPAPSVNDVQAVVTQEEIEIASADAPLIHPDTESSEPTIGDSTETLVIEDNEDLIVESVDVTEVNSLNTAPISDLDSTNADRAEDMEEETPIAPKAQGSSPKRMPWGTVLLASAVIIGGAIAFFRGPGQEQPVPTVENPSRTVELAQDEGPSTVAVEVETEEPAPADDSADSAASEEPQTEELEADPMATLTEAQQLIQDRQVVSALEALATVPQNDDTLFEVEGVLRQVVQQAEAYYKEGLYDEAITVIDTLSELFPRQPITKEAVIASREWQNRWHANLATLKVAEDALEKEEFDSAIAEAQKVTHPGLQVEVATIIDTAIQAKQEAALLAEQARQNRQNRVAPSGSPAPRESVAPRRTAPAPAPRATPQPARQSVTPSPSPSYYSPDPL